MISPGVQMQRMSLPPLRPPLWWLLFPSRSRTTSLFLKLFKPFSDKRALSSKSLSFFPRLYKKVWVLPIGAKWLMRIMMSFNLFFRGIHGWPAAGYLFYYLFVTPLCSLLLNDFADATFIDTIASSSCPGWIERQCSLCLLAHDYTRYTPV
jgi:hypothetical protein